MEYMQSPTRGREKDNKSELRENYERLPYRDDTEMDIDLDKNYDGFELESYIDIDDMEYLTQKKNSFSQRIENITDCSQSQT